MVEKDDSYINSINKIIIVKTALKDKFSKKFSALFNNRQISFKIIKQSKNKIIKEDRVIINLIN